MIQSQADEGADYIAVNVDALSDEEGQLAVKMMKQYIGLVRQWGAACRCASTAASKRP